MAGSYDNAGNYDVGLVRYNVNGTLDSGFGTAGKVRVAIGTNFDYVYGLAVQSDGKIIVVGATDVTSGTDIFVARFTASGALDTAFSGDGKVTASVGSGNDFAWAVTIQPDGKILVAGQTNFFGNTSDFAIQRFTSAGALDTTFSGDGIVTIPFGTSYANAFGIAVQTDGKIVVAGGTQTDISNSGTSDFALIRLTTSGALDTSFDADGKIVKNFGQADVATSVLLQPDGKILIGGGSGTATNSDFAILRYTSSGSLDTTFSGDGIVTTSMGATDEYIWSLVLQPDSKIIAAGNTTEGVVAVARYTSSGALDTSFSADGKLTVAVGTAATVGGAVIQPDGKVVIGGKATVSGNVDFAALRIDGGNLAPNHISISNAALNENSALNTIVGVLSAADPNPTDTLTFSLVSGVGSTDNSAFSISGNELRAAQAFDFEVKRTYSIRVRVTDTYQSTFEKVLFINVNDLVEVAGTANPHLPSSPNTPVIPQIVGGSLTVGPLVKGALELFSTQILAEANSRRAVAVIARADLAPFGAYYTGYDLLLVADMTGEGLVIPRLGVGTTPVEMGMLYLEAYQVYALLIREADTNIDFRFGLIGDETQHRVASGALADGQVMFISNSVRIPLPIVTDADGHATSSFLVTSSDPSYGVVIEGSELVVTAPVANSSRNTRITLARQELLSGDRIAGGRVDQEMFLIGSRGGVISGFVFNDLNGNGTRDSGEPGIPGVTIRVAAYDGQLDATVEYYTVSDASGVYAVAGVGGTSIRVSEVLPSGWVNQSPALQEIHLGSGQVSSNVNFGNRQVINLSQTFPAIGATLVEGGSVAVTASLPSGGSYSTTWQVLGGPSANLTPIGNSLTFTPTDNGIYTVRATTTPGGYIATMTLIVQNAAPTISLATTLPIATEGTPIQLSSGIADPGSADTFTFEWTVTSSNGQSVNTAGWGANPSFIPVDQGTYAVSLKVTDDDGAVVSVEPLPLTVTNAPPQNVAIAANPGFTVAENTLVTLEAQFAEPGGNDAPTFIWSIVNAVGNVVAAGNSAAIEFRSLNEGNYTVSLTVTDKDDAAVTVTRSLSFTNVAPVVGFGANSDRTSYEESPFVVDAAGKWSDAGLLDSHTYLWEVFLNSTRVYTSPTAELTFDPVALGLYSGQYVVRLSVTDDSNATGSGQFNLTVLNSRPRDVSAGLDQTAYEGDAVNLLGAFRDPQLPSPLEQFIFLWEIRNSLGTLVGTGTAPSFSFVPARDDLYIATFTVFNGASIASADTAQIFVANAAPILITSEDVVEIDEGSLLTGSASFFEPGSHDIVTGNVSFGDGVIMPATVNGNSITYGHTYTDNGQFVVRTKVSDGLAMSESIRSRVTVRNVAPTATFSGPTGALAVGQLASFTFSATSDPSAVDAAAGFLYSFDLDGDGIFDSIGTSGTAQHAFSAGGAYVARGRVQDKDGGYTDYDLSVTVDAPPITGLDNDSVPEFQPIGTIVGTLITTDADGTGAYTYSLINGEGADDNAAFTINSNGELRTALVLDRLAGSSKSIRVQSVGPLGVTVANVFTIAVTNFSQSGVAGFRVTGPTDVTAGTPSSVTVTAIDQNGGIAIGYSGPITLASSDGLVVLPANASLISGTGTFPVTLKSSGLQTITAQDPGNTSLLASAEIRVVPSTVAGFVLTAPVNAIAGQQKPFTVTAVDSFGNKVTDYSGTVHFTSTDGAAVLPPNTSLSGGAAVVNVTLKTAGIQTVGVVDVSSSGLLGQMGTIDVTSADATRLELVGPAVAVVGSTTEIVITARDAFGNLAVGYSGDVNFVSSDPAALLPARRNIVKGVGSFLMTYRTAGSQTLSATDINPPAITGTTAPTVVSSRGTSPTSMTAAASNPSVAGQSVTFSVAVSSASGTPTGSVVFSVDGVIATNSALVGGQATFTTSSLTPGVHTIIATYTGDATFAGSSVATNQTVTPTISQIAPFSGPTTGGTTVVITGLGFTGASSVAFGGNPAISYTVTSNSQIIATSPSGSGIVDVAVTNDGVTSSAAGTENDFSYSLAVPTLHSVAVNGGDMYAINAYGVKVAGLSGNNSIIEQLYVTFDIGVTLSPGAFTLDASAVTVNIPVTVNPVPVGTNVVTIIAEPDPTTLDANGGHKGFRLRFSGSASYLNSFDNSPTGNGGAGNAFSTLKDGFYRLNTIGARVHAGSSVAGTPMSNNEMRDLWTMFGSYSPDDRSIPAVPGDGTSIVSVNSSVIDFAVTNGDGYGAGNLSDYNANFDWNLDGDVGDDLIEFAKRFGAEWQSNLIEIIGMVVNGGDMYATNAYGSKVAGLAGNNSIVEQLHVSFNIGVTLAPGAFTLDAGPVNVSIPSGVNPVPQGTNVVAIIAEPDPTSQDPNGGYRSYRLRFSGSSTFLNSFDNSVTGNGGSGNLFTTLKDGFYKLNVIGANIRAGNSIAGTPMSENAVQSFWTMFASNSPDDRSISATPGNGDSIISVNSSVINFASTNGDGYGAGNLADYNANFDWNLDGDVGDDLIEFAKRFGAEWTF